MHSSPEGGAQKLVQELGRRDRFILTLLPLGPGGPLGPWGPEGPRAPGKPGAPAIPGAPCRRQDRHVRSGVKGIGQVGMGRGLGVTYIGTFSTRLSISTRVSLPYRERRVSDRLELQSWQVAQETIARRMLTAGPAAPAGPGGPGSPRTPWGPSEPRAPWGPASPWIGEKEQIRNQPGVPSITFGCWGGGC